MLYLRTGLGALFLFFTMTSAAAVPTQRVETKSFSSAPGDTLIIENDYGRVQIRNWDRPDIEVQIRTIAADEAQLEQVTVITQKSGDKLYLRAYFYRYQSETVYLDIRTPVSTNVIVWGANPAVELAAVNGYVRVHTLTGLITAEDLTSTASLITESGDILYRATVQPSGDIRLESVRGNIQCRVQPGINIRGWMRAGGLLSWNREVEMSRGFLEKQIGIGGPLLYASSLQGNVLLDLDSHMQSQAALDTPSAQTDSTIDRHPSAPPAAEVPVADESAPETVTDYRVTRGPSGTETVESGATFKVDVNLITLNASVRDSYNNRAVANLREEDFQVYENSVLQPIAEFETSEAPISLLLLLDVSGSTQNFIELIKEASIEFTRQIKTNDRIAVAVFNSRSRLVQGFTNDRQQVADAIRRVRSGGGTAFYDALDRSIRAYMDGIEGRKAIVVFSDGVDNQLTGDFSDGSQTTFRDLFRSIQEIDTLIYTIFLDTENRFGGGSRQGGGTIGGILADILRGGGTPPIAGPGRRSEREAYQEARRQMEMIAEQTGARMYAPRQIQDLNSTYSEIADDLRIQYTLGYHSTHPAADGQWRRIDVEIAHRDDLIVRTRKGYYAGRN